MNLKSFFLACISCLLFQQAISQPCNLLPSATHGPNHVCTKRTLYLYGSSPVSGVSYSWTGPNGFNSSLQNPVLPTPSFSQSPADYILTVSKTGCTSESDTVSVVIEFTPDTPLLWSNAPVCNGDELIIYAAFIQAGPGYFHIWNQRSDTFGPYVPLVVPNVTVADIGFYYATGTTIFGGCLSDTSRIYISASNITTNVPMPVPTASVTPGPIVSQYTPVIFKANFSNAGNSPQFQWFQNGVKIPGATDSVLTRLSGVNLANGDSVYVRITRTPTCIDTQYSAPIGIAVTTVINDFPFDIPFTIYPNPNNGQFTIHHKFAKGQMISLNIVNTLGQLVYKDDITVGNGNDIKVNKHSFASGVYYLELQSAAESYRHKFVVER